MNVNEFEDIEHALDFLSVDGSRVYYWNAKDCSSSLHYSDFTENTAAGSYAKSHRFAKLNSDALTRDIIIVQETENERRFFRFHEESRSLESIDVPDFHRPTGFEGSPAEKLINSLLESGFTPDVTPISLADLADSILNFLLEDRIAEHNILGMPRGRSSFPFHDFEAFSSGGPLAHFDALTAVHKLREFFETCSVIIAERWDTRVQLCMDHETNLDVDISPTGFMTFSADAHHLNDWLEITVRELAEGRGNLVVLAKRFASTPELREIAEGELESVHPITENPWTLFIANQGTLASYHLTDKKKSNESDSRE